MTESLLLQAQKIAEMISKKVDKIDLVYLYGGVAQGRSHARSDLDMVAVCDGISVRWQFIKDNRPVNLYSKTWKQLEDTAKGLGETWSVAASSIINSKVMWSKSRDMNERFERVQRLAESGGSTALQRAINSFDSLYGKLWRLQRSIESVDKLGSRFLIWDITNGLVNILAALNNQPLLHNWGKQLHEIEMLDKKPKDFVKRYERFVTAEPQDALSIGTGLVDEVNFLLREWLTNNRQSFDSDVKEIVMDWPTTLEYLNKAYSATEKNKFPAGYYAASDNAEFNLWAFTSLRRVKWDRRSFFSTEESIACLPEEVKKHMCTLLQSRSLTELHTAAKRLTEILSNELEEGGWTLPYTNSLDDALQFLFIE